MLDCERGGTMGIIYCYTNKNTGKKYIGQTIHPEQRKANHLHEATVKGSDYYFHRSIRKHGWDNFDYEVLEDNVEQKDLNDRENHYIDMYDTLWPNGYNQCPANSLDETAIEKMRKTKKARFAAMTPEERRASVEKMVQANTGKKDSEETRRKKSESVKKYLAKNPRVISEETKRKTSESMKRARQEKFWTTKKGGE
jgi:group I intron endonuclease